MLPWSIFLLQSIFCPVLCLGAGVRGRDALRDGRGGLSSGDSRDATWRAGRAAVTNLQNLVTNLEKIITNLQKFRKQESPTKRILKYLLLAFLIFNK